MAGFDPDKYLAAPAAFDPDAYLASDAKPAPSPKKKTFFEVVKEAAKPDIFNTGEASYELGGKVADATGSPMAGYLTNVAAQALPTVVGAFGGSTVGKPVMEGGARVLMKSALKPSPTMDQGKVARAVSTLLKEGHSPTNAGVTAMGDKVRSLSAQVDDLIAPSNKAISIVPAAENVAAVAAKARAGTMGVTDAKAAQDVARALYAHPAVDDVGTMSVQAAQAMKKANYRSLGDAAYGMGLKPAAERDAIKAATRALKEGIEGAAPAVKAPNAQIQELVNALKLATRRAATEGNKDIIPLGSSVATALNNPAAALGLYANSSAAIKAMLARMLYSGADGVPAAAGGAMGAAIGATSGKNQE